MQFIRLEDVLKEIIDITESLEKFERDEIGNEVGSQ